MRTMLKVSFPASTGNRAIKDGSLPKLVEAFTKKHKPEAAYFFSDGGKRTMLYVFDMKDTSDIPSIVEPLFFGLDAEVYATPVMDLDDLKAGLGKVKLGRK